VVLSKTLTNGDTAVLFWNWTASPVVMSCALSSVPGLTNASVNVVDAWDACVTAASGALSTAVNPYGANLYRLAPTIGGATTNTQPAVLTVLTNLALWYKADGHSFPNGSATNWPDSSGHGYNALAVSNQPIYIANAIDGLPAYYFNGAASLATTYTSADSAQCSVFVVYNCTNAADMDQIMLSKDYLRGIVLSARKGVGFRVYNMSYENNGCTTSDWNVMGYINSAGVSRVYGPGCLVSTSTGPATGRFNGRVAVTLGNDCVGCNSPNDWFGGYIAEILYYNTVLSAQAMDGVMGYLRSKYNLP
jgi:hypothetical protein